MITSIKIILQEGADTTITFKLKNKPILSVSREGLGLTRVTGTPGNGEFSTEPILTIKGWSTAIRFSADEPAAPGGERLHVIYRTI